MFLDTDRFPVAPGFDPTGFELAEPGWVPNGAA
jgi:hypothetical protein